MVNTLTEELGPVLLSDKGTTPGIREGSPIVEAARAIHGHLEKLVRRVDL